MRQRLDEQTDHDAGRVRADQDPDPIRPESVVPGTDRLRDWIEWFGVGRLVTSAAAVVVVCAGAWFLVRTPPPPSEASLPMATAAGDLSQTSHETIEPPGATTTTAGPLVVHVAGAVIQPGVYELEPASRVDDAVRRAGGPTPTADPAQLNLATPLADGDRIYVPEVGETVPPPVGPVGSAAAPGPTAPVDLNRAGVGELDELPGIGPATAAAIVTDRELNGPFVSVDDLERVPGIGPAKLAALSGLVTT